jgi:integrase
MHEGRHSFASLLIEAGVSAKKVSTYMGHANISITLDRYSHLFERNERDTLELVDAFIERANTTARLAQLND